MRYTKNHDGLYGSPQQIGYAMQPQQQFFTPQVTVKDNKGHTYNVNMDNSVPYLNLNPKVVNDFLKMEQFAEDASGRGPAGPGLAGNVQRDLKQFVLMKAIGVDDDYLDQFRDSTGIPKSNNEVWKMLCNFYNQEYLQKQNVGRSTQYRYWLNDVLYRYASHHYPGVSDLSKNAIVSFYLNKCHKKSSGSIPSFEERASYVSRTGAVTNETIGDQIRGLNQFNKAMLSSNAPMQLAGQQLLRAAFTNDGRKRKSRKSKSRKSRKSRKSKRKSRKSKSKKSKRKSRSKSRSKKLKKLEKELEEMLMHSKKKSKRKPSKKRKRRSA